MVGPMQLHSKFKLSMAGEQPAEEAPACPPKKPTAKKKPAKKEASAEAE